MSYRNQLASLGLQFLLVDLKPNQELGHCPADISLGTSSGLIQEDELGKKAGYFGPTYGEPFSSIGYLSSSIKTGLILPENATPGAPEQTFVYGATNFNNVFMNAPNIVAAFGPDKTQFDQDGVPDKTKLFPATLPGSDASFIPGKIVGGGAGSACYIPWRFEDFPINVDYATRINTFYRTSNIWDFQFSTMTSAASKASLFTRGVGPKAFSQRGGNVKSVANARDGCKVQFSAMGEELAIWKIDQQPLTVGTGAPWHFTANYFDAYRFGLSPDLKGVTPTYADKVSLFTSSVGAGATGINSGFVLNLDLQPNKGVNAFKNGYPSVVIQVGNSFDIGKSSTGQNDCILGARIELAAGKPIMLAWPVRTTSVSRYFTSSNFANGGRDANSFSKSAVHYVSSQGTLHFSGLNPVIKFEGYGDFVRISVKSQGKSQNAEVEGFIGPQIGVSRDDMGLALNAGLSNSAYPAINSTIFMQINDMNGLFKASPFCYASWDSSAIMFKHQRIELRSSNVFDQYVETTWDDAGNKTSTTKRKQVIAKAWSETVSESMDITGTSGKYKYADAIKDPRGTCPILLTTLSNLDSDGNYTNGTSFNRIAPVENEDIKYIAEGYDTYGFQQIRNRSQYIAPNTRPYQYMINAYPIVCIAMWAHTYMNGQLLTVWPSQDHRDWIKKSYSWLDAIPINGASNLISDEISHVGFTSSLEGCIIKRTANIRITNPDSNTLSFLQNKGALDGNKLWIELRMSGDMSSIDDQNSSRVNDIRIRLVVTSTDFTIKGSGLEISMQAQDPLSLFLDELPYPQNHTVDGWMINDAIQYILRRLGLLVNKDTNISMPDGVGRIGKWIATDVKETSVNFAAGKGAMKSNLLKALGVLPMFQYPIFYWGTDDQIHYRDGFSAALPYGERDYFKTKDNTFYSDYKYYDLLDTPMKRDSFKVSFQNSKMYYQRLLKTKDRFRNTILWAPVGLVTTDELAGYRSSVDHDLTGVLSDSAELGMLQRNLYKQNSAMDDMGIQYSIVGLPLNYISDNGGAGFSYKLTDAFPFTSNTVGSIILDATDIQWDANNGNRIDTSYKYSILKPAVLRINQEKLIAAQ